MRNVMTPLGGGIFLDSHCSSVENKIKVVFVLILPRLRTWHAQYDFWAINILCILALVLLS